MKPCKTSKIFIFFVLYSLIELKGYTHALAGHWLFKNISSSQREIVIFL